MQILKIPAESAFVESIGFWQSKGAVPGGGPTRSMLCCLCGFNLWSIEVRILCIISALRCLCWQLPRQVGKQDQTEHRHQRQAKMKHMKHMKLRIESFTMELRHKIRRAQPIQVQTTKAERKSRDLRRGSVGAAFKIWTYLNKEFLCILWRFKSPHPGDQKWQEMARKFHCHWLPLIHIDTYWSRFCLPILPSQG